MLERPAAPDWVGITADELPLAEAIDFVRMPSCGAVTVFLGTVRDHAPGRSGVTLVEYEAFDEHVPRAIGEIVAEARQRFEGIGRIAVLHRSGGLAVGEISVVVAVSSEHRAAAFEAGRYCIDTLKHTVPIWKHEVWEGGEDWGVDTHPIEGVGS